MILGKLSMDETNSSPVIGLSLFLELPPEIHLRICDFISWPSLMNLRLASQHTAAFLSDRDLVRQHQRFVTELSLKIEFEIVWWFVHVVPARVQTLWLRLLPYYKCSVANTGLDCSLSTFEVLAESVVETKCIGVKIGCEQEHSGSSMGWVRPATRFCTILDLILLNDHGIYII